MPPSTKATTAVGDDEGPVPTISLQRLRSQVLTVRIEGITPVIPHRWSEKALRLMAEKQSGQARTKHAPKHAEEEAEASCYWLPNGRPGIPATAFKAAMVGACRYFQGITMTFAKTLFYVEGEGPDQLVGILGTRTLREDTPRNANGVADLRYRYAFYPWQATLKVHFKPAAISPDSVIALLDAGGSGGVGDWRPSAPKSATGTFGQFKVVE
jgi:hypothetical protein